MSSVRYINRGLTPAMKTLYLDEERADVHFVFKSTNGRFDSVPAHKPLLRATSKVFDKMFNGAWKEKDCVQLIETSSAAFKDFLQFFYLDQVSVSMRTVAAVLKLGQKYDVTECIRTCVRFLSDNVIAENVCWVYNLAIFFHQDELQKLCEVLIGINISIVLKTSHFLTCGHRVLARILKSKSLTCHENELYKATMEWVKVAAKQKHLTSDLISTHLGESFYDIQFEKMTMDEFIEIFSSYETLFTAEKRRQIIHQITAKEFEMKTNINIGREYAWFKLPFIECERDFHISHKPYEISQTEVETFSVNKPLLLRGIICGEVYCFEDTFNPVMEDIPGRIKIYEFCGITDKQGLRVIYEDDDIELECDDCEYNMWLNKPVIIKPGKMYQIRLTLDMDDDFCTNIRMKDNRAQSDGFIVTFHTDQNRGLISGIKFCSY